MTTPHRSLPEAWCDEISRLGREVGETAQVLRADHDRLARAARGLEWESLSADAFRLVAVDSARDLLNAVEATAEAATALGRHAAEVRAAMAAADDVRRTALRVTAGLLP